MYAIQINNTRTHRRVNWYLTEDKENNIIFYLVLPLTMSELQPHIKYVDSSALKCDVNRNKISLHVKCNNRKSFNLLIFPFMYMWVQT